jgi:molecular chaperone DnaK (HSP70)
MPKVAVRFHVDADGLLTVSAKEESSGAKASVEIQPMHGLTDGEVETMLKASFDNAQADFDARRVVDLKAELETMLRVTEKHLTIAREHLDPESLADLEEAVQSGRHAMTLDDPREIQNVRDSFERATLPLAALLMDSVAKSALAGKKLDEV